MSAEERAEDRARRREAMAHHAPRQDCWQGLSCDELVRLKAWTRRYQLDLDGFGPEVAARLLFLRWLRSTGRFRPERQESTR